MSSICWAAWAARNSVSLQDIESLFVILGVIFVVLQLYIQAKQMRQANYIAVMEGRGSITLREMEKPELLSIYTSTDFPPVTNLEDFNRLTADQKVLYLHLGTLMSAQERAHTLFTTLPRSKDDLKAELTATDELANLPMFDAVWPYMRQFYKKSFVNTIDVRRRERAKAGAKPAR